MAASKSSISQWLSRPVGAPKVLPGRIPTQPAPNPSMGSSSVAKPSAKNPILTKDVRLSYPVLHSYSDIPQGTPYDWGSGFDIFSGLTTKSFYPSFTLDPAGTLERLRIWLDWTVAGTIVAAQLSKGINRAWFNNENNEEAFYADGSTFDILTTIMTALAKDSNSGGFARYSDNQVATTAVQAFAKWDIPLPLRGQQFTGRIDLAAPATFGSALTSATVRNAWNPRAVPKGGNTYYIEARELDNIQTIKWQGIRGLFLNVLDAGSDWNALISTFKLGGSALSQDQVQEMEDYWAEVLRSSSAASVAQSAAVFSGNLPKYDPGTVGYYTIGGFYEQPVAVSLKLKSLQTVYVVTITDTPFEPIGSTQG